MRGNLVKKLFRRLYYDIGKWMFRKHPKWMCDKWYLTIVYNLMYWRRPDFDNPRTLVEKLQWLKMHDHNPQYVQMVDKYAMKQYVRDNIGDEYVIPTLGLYDSVDDIDLESLPDSFVVKCTHDSGSAQFWNKKELNSAVLENRKAILKHHLEVNFYWTMREWPYKKVKPRLLVEPFLENPDGTPIVDYKFYCYGGELQYFMYSIGEAQHQVRNLKFSPEKISIDHLFKEKPVLNASDIVLPSRIDEMIELAKRIGSKYPHIRIDMYCINDKIYIGEFTFYSNGGFIEIYDKSYAQFLANQIDLTSIN